MILSLATACGADASDQATDEELNPNAQLSYAIGWQTGQNIVQQNLEVDENSLIQGLSDALDGADSKWTDEEMKAALQQLQQTMMARQQAKTQEQASANQAASREFLRANEARDEVTTLSNGLQYEVLSSGDGPKPAATDTVTVHYRGTLIDGTEFDSSYSRGTPATFALNRVIAGWTQGLQLMNVGSKWKLYIPAELGYGMRGSPPRIGPGAALVFEVELLEIAE